jgi:hypothetical protein
VKVEVGNRHRQGLTVTISLEIHRADPELLLADV